MDSDNKLIDFAADHLAILPGQPGACSLERGCGLGVNTPPEVKARFQTTTPQVDGYEALQRLYSNLSGVGGSCGCAGTCSSCSSSLSFNRRESPLGVPDLWTDDVVPNGETVNWSAPYDLELEDYSEEETPLGLP